MYAGLAALGPAVVVWSQWAFYGHPFAPGYPGWESFYQAAFIPHNWHTYPRFLTTVHSPLIFLSLLTPFLLLACAREVKGARVVAWSAMAFAVSTFALYLSYIPFDDLHFLRFMLPAVAALFVLLAALTVLVARRLGRTSKWISTLAMLPALYVAAAPPELFRYEFTLNNSQRRVVLMGRYLEAALPRNAVIVSFLQSGALAHYTQRPIVRLDLLPAESLDSIVDDLVQRGYRPVVVVDEIFELPDFRARFPNSRHASLGWTPRARFRDATSSILYFDLADGIASPSTIRPETDVVAFP